jgi:L-alanine-DL-glutamate epimerase-like enolase superfamily enzyme
MADMGGIRATCQSSAAELGPNNAYMLHWITSSPEFTGTNDSSTHLLEPPSWDIIKNEFKTKNGTLSVPEGPGLGVEVDPHKLSKSEELAKQGMYPHEKGLGRRDKYYWG